MIFVIISLFILVLACTGVVGGMLLRMARARSSTEELDYAIGLLGTIMLLCIVLGLFIHTVQAADNSELFVTGSLGVFNSGKRSLAESKFLKVGEQDQLSGILYHRASLGLWIDNAGDGRSGSGFTAYQVGFDIKNQALEASFFTGPAFITTPDVYLGGHLQFNETVFLGVRDSNTGGSLGVAYDHFSSAGLETPNIGRDFMGLQVHIPF